MPKYEIGPSAKTTSGVFIEATASRYSAEAVGRQTVWQSPTTPLPPNRREQQEMQRRAHAARLGQTGSRIKPKPTEGRGSGSWDGRDTPLGKMRPVSRAGEGREAVQHASQSPIARSAAKRRAREMKEGEDEGDRDAWDGAAFDKDEEIEMQVFEHRKRKAEEEERKAIFEREFAVARLEALLKFLEMGNSKALFKKMNSRNGNRRFVSRYQLESKPSTHASPGAKGSARANAAAVNQAIFAPGAGRPMGTAASLANGPGWAALEPRNAISAPVQGNGGASVAEQAGAAIPSGALRVLIAPQMEADLREVFTFYCQYGDRLNTSFMSSAKTAKLAKDVGIIPHLIPPAGMDILYSRAAARDGVLSKLVFWEFCTLIEDVAEAVAPDEPLQAVFDEIAAMIIERGQRMPLDDIAQQESLMAEPRLWNMLAEHELAFNAIFDFYAHMFPEGGEDETDRGERTKLDQVVSFPEFHQFALDFHLFPQCLSKPALVRLFVNSNAGTAADDAAAQMSFPEFLQTLMRIALVTDLRGREPGEMSKFERFDGIPYALSTKAVEERKRQYPGLPVDPPVQVGFSHLEKAKRDARDSAELGCMGVGTAKQLMFESGRSIQSAGVPRRSISPPPSTPLLKAAAAAGVGAHGAHMRSDVPVQSSGYTYGVPVSPPRSRPMTTPMGSRSMRRRSRSPRRQDSRSGDGQPRWQLGFKGTNPAQYPPPLGSGRPGTASPVGGDPYYGGEGLDGGFSYASSAYLPAVLTESYDASGWNSFSTSGTEGGFTRRKPAANPDVAISPEERLAWLERAQSAREASITRLSIRRQEREGLQIASNQPMVQARVASSKTASSSSRSLIDIGSQLSSIMLDRPQTAGFSTSSKGLISLSDGSGLISSPKTPSRPMAGKNRGTPGKAHRAMPLVPSGFNPRKVVSALPGGGGGRHR